MNIKLCREKLETLDSFKIKIIACFCMTVDHVGAFGSDILGSWYYTIFRMIGRIAAPLFLFILVQSIRHTRNRTNFLKRLYLAGAVIGLSNTIFNVLGANIFGIHDFGNTLFTFFYVGFYVTIIEKISVAIPEKNIRECAKSFGILGISLLLCMVYRIIEIIMLKGLPVQQRVLIRGIRDSLIPTINHLEYGIGFVLLGICLYFVKKKTLQCAVYFIFCIICICGATVAVRNPDIYIGSSFTTLYFAPMQCWMILALPIMMLYNQKKGRNIKGFFYWYYPVHRYVIVIVSAMLGSG